MLSHSLSKNQLIEYRKQEKYEKAIIIPPSGFNYMLKGGLSEHQVILKYIGGHWHEETLLKALVY